MNAKRLPSIAALAIVACGHAAPVAREAPKSPATPPKPAPKAFPAFAVSLAEPPPPSPLVALPLWSVAAHHPGEAIDLMHVDCTRESSQHLGGQRCGVAGAPRAAFPELRTARARACTKVTDVETSDAVVKWLDRADNGPPPSDAELPPNTVIVAHVSQVERDEALRVSRCDRARFAHLGCDPIASYEFVGPPSEPEPIAVSIWLDRRWHPLEEDTKGNTRPDDLASLLFPRSWVAWEAPDPRFVWDRSSSAPPREQAAAMRERLAAIDERAASLPIQAALAVSNAYFALLFDERDHLAQAKTRLEAVAQRLGTGAANRAAVAIMASAVDGVLRGTLVTRDPCPLER